MASKDDGFLANWKCLAACVLVSMSPFQYGIDFGLIGGMQAMPGFLKVFGYEDPNVPLGWNISHGRQQLISSLMTLGAFIGSTSAGPMASFMGRKPSLWVACILCCVSTVIMMVTTDIGGLYAGRLLIGIANGFFMTFSQLWLQESTPAKFRGVVLATFQFWTAFGTLIGTIVDNFTAKNPGRSAYMIPLGLIFIVPGLLSAGLFLLPESPRWLVQHNKIDKARKSLHWLRPKGHDVEKDIREIQGAINIERELSKGIAVMDLFANPVDRRRTFLSVWSVTLQAGSGAMYIIAYKTYFFAMANTGSPFENACITGAIGVVAIIINSCVITRIGRRRVFLMTGLVCCGFSQIIMAAVYDAQPMTQSTGRLVIGMTVLFILSYNGMISAYAWLCGGEIPSQHLRSYTFGLSAAIGFLFAWLTTFTAPYFINPDSLNWGPRYGYIWFPSCLICAVWVFFYLPETKDRTLEEITEMFEARVPARKFRGYKCVGLANRATIEKQRDSSDGLEEQLDEKEARVEEKESV